MLTKPILDRVTTLGDDLAQETKAIILGGEKRLKELNPVVKNIATGLSNKAKNLMGKPQTSDSVLERAEWAAELDSRAFNKC